MKDHMSCEQERNSAADTQEMVPTAFKQQRQEEIRVKKKRLRIIALALALAAVPFLVLGLIANERIGNPLASILIICAIASPLAGIIMWIVSLRLGKKQIGGAGREENRFALFIKKNLLSVVALALVLAAPVFFGLTVIVNNLLGTFEILFLLFTIISPIVGMVLGIVSLSFGKKQTGKDGIIISSIAVALPVVFVLVMILLFKTGVAVISFM